MNRLKLDNVGGFPLDQDTLAFMQEAYSLFNALGEIVGNLSILKGVEVTGATASDGVVYINGEVLPFKGGAITSHVIIEETVVQLEFEGGELKDVEIRRQAKFGNSLSGAFPWASFFRASEIKRRLLPAGTNPQLFCGSVNNIPFGWQLCDGTNGTPDLRGQFIVGFDPNVNDYNAIGKTGGSNSVVLTEAQMPLHNHETYVVIWDNGHRHLFSDDSNGATNSLRVNNDIHPVGSATANISANNTGTGRIYETSESEADITGGVLVFNTGGDQPHENRPPYYTLAYIIYTGN
ncbi:MAG: hypothetical protein M9958_03150 [Chitinophagales bacterium]|nr:hypothetical protein [Chitinophagales bacterium]